MSESHPHILQQHILHEIIQKVPSKWQQDDLSLKLPREAVAVYFP